MIRLKWANGEHEVTGCGECPMRGFSNTWGDSWCQVDADGRDVTAARDKSPDWCPLLTLEVEREPTQ